jgi:hypothetical protein
MQRRERRTGVSVPHGPTSGAEARFPFLDLIGTSGTRALPGPSRAGFIWRSSKSQKQVPHRAFGPVRNDKGCWVGSAVCAALKRRSSTVVYAAVDSIPSEAKAKSKAKSTATDRSARSTRTTPTPTAPGFARWTAEGGCPHIYLGGRSLIHLAYRSAEALRHPKA